ncbi:PKD domain-containing protein [Patescibacteria group bacterium]|nr:PKD domain-containing protein [Patescibacteria group bacterium]MBU1956466.1 PKD domain-containing protein [Patescibacteria group bacterium]
MKNIIRNKELSNFNIYYIVFVAFFVVIFSLLSFAPTVKAEGARAVVKSITPLVYISPYNHVNYGAKECNQPRYCWGSTQEVIDGVFDKGGWYPATWQTNVLIEYENEITGNYTVSFQWLGDGYGPDCGGDIYVSQDNINWTKIVTNKTATTKQTVQQNIPFKYLKNAMASPNYPSYPKYRRYGGTGLCGWVQLREIEVRYGETGDTPNIPPIASFTVVPSSGSGDTNTIFTFDGSASRDPEGSALQYRWDIGNGTWTGWGNSSPKLDYKYSSAGSYLVKLEVKDPGGLTNVATKTVTVSAVQPPTLTVSVNPTSIFPGEEITFTWSSTNATDCKGSLGGVYPISGFFNDTPALLPRTYTLTCTGPGGSVTKSATVTEKISPTLSLDITDLSGNVVNDSNPVYPGESVTITWNPVSMTSCSGTLTNFSSIPGSVANVPTFPSSPPYKYTYTINCAGMNGLSYSASKVVKSTRDNGVCDPGETYSTSPKDCPFTVEPF